MIDASVMRDSTTKKSRGFGFVQFAVSASGQKAVAATLASGRFELDGRAIEVKSAVPVGAITGSPSSLQPVSSPRGSPSSTAGTKSQSALTSSPQIAATRPIATSTSSSPVNVNSSLKKKLTSPTGSNINSNNQSIFKNNEITDKSLQKYVFIYINYLFSLDFTAKICKIKPKALLRQGKVKFNYKTK